MLWHMVDASSCILDGGEDGMTIGCWPTHLAARPSQLMDLPAPPEPSERSRKSPTNERSFSIFPLTHTKHTHTESGVIQSRGLFNMMGRRWKKLIWILSRTLTLRYWLYTPITFLFHFFLCFLGSQHFSYGVWNFHQFRLPGRHTWNKAFVHPP